MSFDWFSAHGIRARIPLVDTRLVGYLPRIYTNSYPTRTHKIIVKYTLCNSI